jgi:integrase
MPATALALQFGMLLPQEEADLARRRLQQKGDLYQQGGWWKLRWKVDVVRPDGSIQRAWSKPVMLAPARGNGMGLPAWTKKEATREAWEKYLSKLDQNNRMPQSVMTVAQFVEHRFTPGHVAMLKPSGQSHYGFMLRHVLAGIGRLPLRDVTSADVQRLCSGLLARRVPIIQAVNPKKRKPVQPRNYSVQTAVHVRTAVSAIFSYAKEQRCYAGENPAQAVKLPEMTRKERHALTFGQLQALLAAVSEPARTLILMQTLLSMNVAECLGLQWKRVNLGDQWTNVDGEAIPPHTIAVRIQWYRGSYGTVKKKARRRNLPIPGSLETVLDKMRRREKYAGPDDAVFASETGRPVDEHNIAARVLKKVGAKLGMPWLSWHCFRRTHTTLADQLGLAFGDRMAMMGHSDMRMTALYTVGDLERRRTVVELMGSKIMGEPKGGIQ